MFLGPENPDPFEVSPVSAYLPDPVSGAHDRQSYRA